MRLNVWKVQITIYVKRLLFLFLNLPAVPVYSSYVGLDCEGPCPCGLAPAAVPPHTPWKPQPDPYFQCGCSPFDIDPVCTGEETIWNGCMAICQGKEYKCSSECPC